MTSLKFVSLVLLLSSFVALKPAFSCTAFSFIANEPVVAKNLDWFPGHALIFVNKRNTHKDGILVKGHPTASWTSRFMSLTISENGVEFPWEGMNEAGLSVNSLELVPSVVPAANGQAPIDYLQWIQYILDTSGNVGEAIANAGKVRVVAPTTIHYFVCDASGACAVFENIKGEFVISTGAQLPVKALTNNTYADSMNYFTNLRQTHSPSDILASKSSESLDRFSRGAILSTSYSANENPISFAFSGLTNVAEYFPKWGTDWKMVFALRSKIMNIETAAAPSVKWVNLLAFNPSCKSGRQILDVNDLHTNDVTGLFRPYTEEANTSLAEAYDGMTKAAKDRLAIYPSQQTRCLE